MKNHKGIKCVVWDLDNTLWNGILLEGDDLKLKPGIVNVIEELDQRGILHSIASKGVHEDAIRKLKEFKLEKFFLYPEINWNAKSQSIAKIQNKLNIGMDTLMFIDDQPFERDEVKSKHPAVTCIDADEYLNLISNPQLNPKFITQDSAKRRLMYVEDQRRKTAENDFEIVRVPAMKTADDMGLRLVSNMVMLGALVKKSGVFPMKALENALHDLVKSKALKLDINAVRAGTDFV